MIANQTLQDFINSPDTVDIVLRRTELVDKFIAENPEVVATQTVGGRYLIAYVNIENFESVINAFGDNILSSVPFVFGLLARPELEASGIIQVHDQPFLNLLGNGVLIGYVDTGIDYTLDIFKYEDGTSKINYIYDQTIADGPPPEGFFFGTEYNNQQINEALQADDPYSVVPHRDTVGHGTFLASVSAGRESGGFIGAAPGSELIVVKVRKAKNFYLQRYRIPISQENAFGSNSVMLGIQYVLTKARELNKPVVICLGLGTNSGSHDGFSLFEEFLNVVSTLNGVCLCLAGGNESQARHHTQGVIPLKGASQNIDIRAGDDAANFSVSIWNTVADRISVSVRSPTGEIISRVPARNGLETKQSLVLENAVVSVSYFFPVEGSGGQATIVAIDNATPGIWTIIVHGDIILDGTYHAWLPLTGFVAPSVEFLAADPYTTIVVPATALGPITVGAYDTTSNSLYSNSSWGPTRIPAQMPDLVAPGVNVGGVFPDGLGTMTGTSVASAITAGACALLMQWGIAERNDIGLSTYQIKAFLVRGAERTSSLMYPNYQWGYGKLNLLETFNLMRQIT